MIPESVPNMHHPSATLFIVATPIGNRDDITLRAIQVLQDVTRIAAEDTRHSRPLLTHLGIDTPLTALHEHNEDAVVDGLVRQLQQGDDIALISDAGTPLISDPGYRLVRAARAAGIRVVPLPGPCAAIAALSVGGLPSDRFVFEGFLPAKASARRARLAELAGETRTMIFYESPRRVAATLDAMRESFGDQREAVLARELTKMFETVLDRPLVELARRVAADPDQQRGECVLLVAGSADPAEARLSEGRRLFALLSAELPPSRAAKLAASISGAPRKALYEDRG
ncbi:16S rRNA (cytidine(1402)-2'-O)-methyltransferase [Oleiagrimonas sp.]|jgi:16S rRNA (cytidine1402-2'-O)-methyltransferase|uniref:16S rRNA (cytidine(1402)-2'-O)-methyltransferase n=1 Tax=Oleiagrimonas sp. TaxID=2010330 RepID=UPI002625729B|nr:16S rRNA (cytidine(1402)-2'-O)-methyltransferase [Oleiagrimonas sp.]MDA3914901.1 16S rRNA (cytidine(1402)-2'-O)-methyltransferase [Oleiagrimonas sp.]